MNNQTFEQTQFQKIKEEVAKLCLSSYGKKILWARQPSPQLATVETWQTETAEAKIILNSNQHVPFMGLTQLEQITNQLEKGFILEAHELIDFADFLRSGRLIRQFFEKNQFQTPLLFQYSSSLPDFIQIEEAIYSSIQHSQVSSDASRELRRTRKQIAETEKEIESKLQKFLHHPDNRSKIQDMLVIRKGDVYTIPIKSSFKNQLSGTIIEESHKGTTAFIEPIVVQKLNQRLQELNASEAAEEYQILAYLTGLLAENFEMIRYSIDAIVELDVIFARGKFSRNTNGQSVKINKEERISIKHFLHPLLDSPVPLTVQIGGEQPRGLTITGPNAGGKTVVLKSVGLATLMTMFGLQIQADSESELAIFDQIFVDIGDQQSLENALSTFSGHLHNLSGLLSQAKRHTLVLLDEIGSGTEPTEGAALAIAILESFYQKGSLIISTTHYGEIKNFSQAHEDFTTAAMAFDAATLTPKYQLLMGETGESNALWIAQKMHLDQKIITKARQYMTAKNYQLNKETFTIKNKNAKTIPVTNFQQGDRVKVNDTGMIGLVYQVNEQEQQVSVYTNQTYHWIAKKRLTLLNKADDLYPENYDLTQLFTDFQTRKKDKDLLRGSKKSHKELRQEAQNRKKTIKNLNN